PIAIPALIASLKYTSSYGTNMDFGERDTAEEALALIGIAAVPALIATLQAGPANTWGEREGAALPLGKIGFAASQAVPALAEALWDVNQMVRAAAAHALHRLGPEVADEILPTLSVRLNDANANVREWAADALTEFEMD